MWCDQPIGDELLALMFVACHPVLPLESRVALTLRLIGGLTTEEIARAYLVPSATVGQRISRAKRTLSEAQVPFAVPEPDELPARLRAVLEVRLPDLQRGLRGHLRATVAPAGPGRGGDAAGPGAGRADAARAGGRTGWSR